MSDAIGGLPPEQTCRDQAAHGEDAVVDYLWEEGKLGDPEGRDVVSPPTATREGPIAPFRSILFDGPESSVDLDERQEPAYFSDLNLDQILESLTAGRDEYDLKPFFYKRLGDVEAIHYRHEVLRDLEGRTVLEPVKSFAKRMRDMRVHLGQADKRRHKYQKQSWFLAAVELYCDAVDRLGRDLSLVEVKSRGLLAFREYLSSYAGSPEFTSIVAETNKLKDDLSQVRYCLRIKGNRIGVRKYDSEADYSADVQKTFERFKQGAVKDYRVDFSDWPDINHVEANILDLVARLFSDVFSALDDYCGRHRDYLNATIRGFDREAQFYIAYLEYIARFKSAGLNFCYPGISRQLKAVHAHDSFDLALANKLVPQGAPVVCNEFYLNGPERIFVVSGPNQGGKTTFARTFGQLHHLAGVGYPVPGTEARLFLCDKLFTHFEREEHLTNLSGKLEEDLVRIRNVLGQATMNSVIIMNEIFTSTTLNDALLLGKKLMEKIIQLDLLCVYVTFIDELASLSESTVSMVSTIVPENPAQRTYKVVRRPADGLAYAIAIAEKYGLTYRRLKERIAS